MNDKAKIAALREALERGYKSLASAAMCQTSDGEAAWSHMGEALALTADDAEQAPCEQAAFERWMLEEAKCAVGSSDPYPAGLERLYRSLWNSARQTAPAPIAAEPPPKLTECRHCGFFVALNQAPAAPIENTGKG